MEDGYAIQQHLVSRLLADGETIVGYKLGLTSLPMQQLLGVDSPDFGPVFASGVFRDGAVLPVDRFIAPRVEAEIGVILAADLSGPHCTPAQALAATAGLVAAVEIVDSRIADWRIKLADTVADLASNGAIALSSLVVPVDGFDPRLLGMVFTRNGEVVATGAGAAALGDPLAAVAWLANTLAPMGVTLPAGSVIMTGRAARDGAGGTRGRLPRRLRPARPDHDPNGSRETLRRSRCGARSWGPATSART